MDNRAIGVFDSGLGGLTAVRRLQEIMPQERIIYFGDTGRGAVRYARPQYYHQIRAAGCGFPPAVRPEGDHRRLQYGFFGCARPARRGKRYPNHRHGRACVPPRAAGNKKRAHRCDRHGGDRAVGRVRAPPDRGAFPARADGVRMSAVRAAGGKRSCVARRHRDRNGRARDT